MKNVKFALLVVAVMGCLISGCTNRDAPKQKIDNDGLTPVVVNNTWELLTIRELDAIMKADTDKPAVLELKEDGTFNMATGCGELSGTFTLDGNIVAFEVMLATTVITCSDTQVEQALAVENIMQYATRYGIEGDELVVAIDDNRDAMFKLKP